MNRMLPHIVAALLISAPVFPSIYALFPANDAPEVPFHTPAHTEGRALPPHIQGSVTLRPEDGVILVHQEVTVAKDATLTIKPGTTLAVAEYAGLQIFGHLEARGTEKNPIRFISNELNETNRNWNGITFEDAGSGLIEHAIFHHASPSVSCATSGNTHLANNTYLFGNIDLFGPC